MCQYKTRYKTQNHFLQCNYVPPLCQYKTRNIKLKINVHSVTMCPLCANCSTWPLHQICDYTRVACKETIFLPKMIKIVFFRSF